MFASLTLRRFVVAIALAAAISFGGSPAQARAEDQPTVHVVGIAGPDHNEDKDARAYFEQKLAEDAKSIVGTFKDAFAKAGRSSQLKTYLLLGADATPSNVCDQIARLDVKPNDTLVVLVSCHGTIDRQGHFVVLENGNLYRKDLLAAMKTKNPRLMVLLTDCCSGNGVGAKPSVKSYEPRNLNAGQIMEWATVNNLFLQHRGLVDITAAEPGYPSAIDLRKSGSVFTNALTRILKAPHADLVRKLDKDGDSHLQWDEVLPQLRGLATQYDRAQSRNPNARPQHSYAYSLGRWMPTTQGMSR